MAGRHVGVLLQVLRCECKFKFIECFKSVGRQLSVSPVNIFTGQFVEQCQNRSKISYMGSEVISQVDALLDLDRINILSILSKEPKEVTGIFPCLQ